jgi:Na+-transporting methylmalonyl-CoA/oxaloacetate decarboxylase gamma subunit
MAESVTTGLSIAVLGMAIVFCFIALLALAIHMLARFKGEAFVPAPDTSDELAAVIGAALCAHRLTRGSAERRDES